MTEENLQVGPPGSEGRWCELPSAMSCLESGTPPPPPPPPPPATATTAATPTATPTAIATTTATAHLTVVVVKELLDI